MQQTMTINIITSAESADAPEDLKEAARNAINGLTEDERAELLAMIKESRCER